MGTDAENGIVRCCYLQADLGSTLRRSLLAHSAQLILDGEKAPRSPEEPVSMARRLRIKQGWPEILDLLDAGDMAGAIKRAEAMGISKDGLKSLVIDRVKFALHTFQVSTRLGVLPDLLLLGEVANVSGAFDEKTLPVFLQAVLHPAIASRITETIVKSRAGVSQDSQIHKGKLLEAVLMALQNKEEEKAQQLLKESGYGTDEQENPLQSHWAFTAFVLDAVLPWEADNEGLNWVIKMHKKPYEMVSELQIYPTMKHELSADDLKVLNVALDACRAG